MAEALKEVERRCGTDGVNFVQIFNYCVDRKMADPKKHTEIGQLAVSKINDLLLVWKNILPHIRKMADQ